MLDLNAIATKIANARKEKGFTQEELSVRLGVSYQAVSKWERGLSLPDVELLLDVSKLLDMSLNELLDNAERTHEFNSPGKSIYDSNFVALCKESRFDLICITIGADLIPMITPDFLQKVVQIRSKIFKKMGVWVSPVRILDDVLLAEKDICLSLFGKEYAKKSFEHVTEETERSILDLLEESIQNCLYRFVNRHMVKIRVDQLKNEFPFCVDGVIPERISLSKLKLVLKTMVKDGYSIHDLYTILETIDEHLEMGSDLRTLIEALQH